MPDVSTLLPATPLNDPTVLYSHYQETTVNTETESHMRIKKLSAALGVGVCLTAVLVAVQPAFAKTVCAEGGVVESGGTNWGNISRCTCSNVSGYVRGRGGVLSFQLMTRAESGDVDNEVWSLVMEEATGGTVTRWVYQYVDNPGGGYSVAGYQGSPDWILPEGQPLRAVCAN